MQAIKNYNNVEDEEVHVACPCCRNKRLFDADISTEGIIKIKCPACRSVIAVSFHLKEICTTRIAL
jgi:predicted  nucleic acid-binding Zn ribbon protein